MTPLRRWWKTAATSRFVEFDCNATNPDDWTVGIIADGLLIGEHVIALDADDTPYEAVVTRVQPDGWAQIRLS